MANLLKRNLTRIIGLSIFIGFVLVFILGFILVKTEKVPVELIGYVQETNGDVFYIYVSKETDEVLAYYAEDYDFDFDKEYFYDLKEITYKVELFGLIEYYQDKKKGETRYLEVITNSYRKFNINQIGTEVDSNEIKD